jgi:hypothetical protein
MMMRTTSVSTKIVNPDMVSPLTPSEPSIKEMRG